MGHPVQKQHRLWLNKFNTQWYHIYSSQEPERVPRRPGAPLADRPPQPLQDHQARHSHSQLQVRNSLKCCIRVTLHAGTSPLVSSIQKLPDWSDHGENGECHGHTGHNHQGLFCPEEQHSIRRGGHWPRRQTSAGSRKFNIYLKF